MNVGCAVLGHRFRFAAVDAVMTWRCTRCEAGGSKTYPRAADAARYAEAFDETPRERAEGFRMVPLGVLPLEIARRWRTRRQESL